MNRSSRRQLPAKSCGPRRGGHTLLELVVSVTAGSLLLAGLGSTMYIATRTANTTRPTQQVIVAATVVSSIVDELTYTTFVRERSEATIEFLVSDRDGDGQRDTIRYEWSGVAGDPLLRTLNHGEPMSVAADVQEFALTYDIKEQAEEIPTTQESDETLLDSHTSLTDSHSRIIKEGDWAGQYIGPEYFTSQLPEDAIDWRVTKVAFQAKQDGSADGVLAVEIREAGNDRRPTSTVLAEEGFQEADLASDWAWKEIRFTEPTAELDPKANIALVIRSIEGGNAAKVRRDDHQAFGWLETSNYGASWKYEAGRKMYYKLYGTYTTPGPDLTVRRKYLACVHLSLRLGDDPASRVDTGAPMLNTPELLSGYWKLDFDADPTAADINGDDQGDWARRDGEAFDAEFLAGSVWSADSVLDTSPSHDFDGVTTVDVRFRNTSLGAADDLGAVFWINADWSDDASAAPLVAALTLQQNGTQVLTVSQWSEPSELHSLVIVPELSADFVSLRLVIEPVSNTVAVWVDNVFRGSRTYTPAAGNVTEHCASIFAEGSGAEFDWISIRVAEPD